MAVLVLLGIKAWPPQNILACQIISLLLHKRRTGCVAATNERNQHQLRRFLAQGQASVEAALFIPVVMLLLLICLQPAIILYDRMVIGQAAAEVLRITATRPQELVSDELMQAVVMRKLALVPDAEIFHIGTRGEGWEIVCDGDERRSTSRVRITHKLRLLPLLDAVGSLAGFAPGGALEQSVEHTRANQPHWLDMTTQNPERWSHSWEESC